MNQEIWKPIKNYEGLYEVSNLGNVKGLKRNKILKPNITRTGYYLVRLYDKNHKSKSFLIHRLVAEMFIPNINNKKTVNHKNEIKSDNRVENLEWLTTKEQNEYGTRIDRVKSKLNKKVNQYDKLGNFIKCWNSIKEAEQTLNLSTGKISRCCRNEYGRKTVGGYIWRYENGL